MFMQERYQTKSFAIDRHFNLPGCHYEIVLYSNLTSLLPSNSKMNFISLVSIIGVVALSIENQLPHTVGSVSNAYINVKGWMAK